MSHLLVEAILVRRINGVGLSYRRGPSLLKISCNLISSFSRDRQSFGAKIILEQPFNRLLTRGSAANILDRNCGLIISTIHTSCSVLDEKGFCTLAGDKLIESDLHATETANHLEKSSADSNDDCTPTDSFEKSYVDSGDDLVTKKTYEKPVDFTKIEIAKLPVVMIVGRPNVGKSALFNRLIRRREALVYNTPDDHVTCDIREGVAKLGDLRFRVLDSTGLEAEASSGSILHRTAGMTARVLSRSHFAIFLTDGRFGLHPLDLEVGKFLRKHAPQIKPIVVMNKCESLFDASDSLMAAASEMFRLGFGDPIAISAETGLGLPELYQSLRPVLEDYMLQVLNGQRALLSLLEQCLTMSHIKQIQSLLTVSGTISDPFMAIKVITTCATSDFGDLYHSYQLFRCLPCQNRVIWNTMIKAFAERGDPTTSLSLYTGMLQNGFLPNNYTFSFLFRACTKLSALSMGFMLHDHVIKLGWESYDFVQNGLIHLYASCNIMDSARKLFDLSLNRDVITWTALINGYAKLGQVRVARELFEQMPEKNAVSWSAMINGYAQLGCFKEALELFSEMLDSGYKPTPAGIVSALTACAFLGALDQGSWIHAYIDRNKMELDTMLGTALIDMYAKCGYIETARSVFNKMPIRDVFAFTSLISGLANHDQSAGAVELFDKMWHEGVAPNEVTFICVLTACSRMGLVDKGLRIFKSMREDYGIEPWVQHYGCLVDLLGRAGMLEEVKSVVRKMPMEPDSYVLGALLNACRMHGDVELASEVFRFLNEQNLDHGGVHTLLSNMFASAKQWEDVAKVRTGMQEKMVRKIPGSSSIEINGAVCEFVSGNYSHHLTGEIMLALFEMEKHLKSVCLEDDGDDK